MIDQDYEWEAREEREGERTVNGQDYDRAEREAEGVVMSRLRKRERDDLDEESEDEKAIMAIRAMGMGRATKGRKKILL